jgi:hypothetical protein
MAKTDSDVWRFVSLQLLPLVLMKDIALREMSLDPDLLTRTTLLPLIPESKLLLVLVLVTDTV